MFIGLAVCVAFKCTSYIWKADLQRTCSEPTWAAVLQLFQARLKHASDVLSRKYMLYLNQWWVPSIHMLLHMWSVNQFVLASILPHINHASFQTETFAQYTSAGCCHSNALMPLSHVWASVHFKAFSGLHIHFQRWARWYCVLFVFVCWQSGENGR